MYSFWMQVSSSGYMYSRLYLEETTTGFFDSGPNWVIFSFFILFYLFIYLFHFLGGWVVWGWLVGGWGGNNSSKQCQIELRYWPQVVLIILQMPFKRFWKTQIFTRILKYLKFWVFGPILAQICLTVAILWRCLRFRNVGVECFRRMCIYIPTCIAEHWTYSALQYRELYFS